MIEATEQTLETAKDKSLGLQRFLLGYLLADEKKHRAMREGIERVKRPPYLYWPHESRFIHDETRTDETKPTLISW